MDWNVEPDDISRPTSSPNRSNGSIRHYQSFNCKQIDKSELGKLWKIWIRGLENIFKFQKVTESKEKKIQLLVYGGLELQEVFYDLPDANIDSDDEDSVDPYEHAVAKLTQHFDPKRHELFVRHKFWEMSRTQGETLENFVLRVIKAAASCDFGTDAHTAREKSILDKIIQGVPTILRTELLRVDDLTLEKANHIISTYQSVNYQVNQMGSEVNRTDSEINRMDELNVNRIAENSQCHNCGMNRHRKNQDCPAWNKFCMSCGIKGHFARCCSTRKQSTSRDENSRYKWKRNHKDDHDDDNQKKVRKVRLIEEIEDVLSINGTAEKVIASIDGCKLQMIIDSGSKFNLIDEKSWELMKANGLRMRNQRESSIRFRAYGSYPLEVITVFDAKIEIQDGNKQLISNAPFYVIKGGQEPLLGRQTAQELKILIIGLPSQQNSSVYTIDSQKQDAPFPKMRNVKIRLEIDKSIKPSVIPLRSIPVSLEDKVKSKIEEMFMQDIIEKVEEYCEWGSPMVPVFKDNGEVRICIDMRRPNLAIKRIEYPLPTIDEMLPRFCNAKYFTTLDIKQAFFQLELHEESRYITTFRTPWGRYRFKRLMFGVNCAPEIFQRTLENLLTGIKNVINFIDDILVWGDSEISHDNALNEVLRVLRQHGVLLNTQKCKYKQTKVKFLGYEMSEMGIKATDDKVAAISRCREPATREEVRSFLGLVTYVGRFIPDLATINEPLRRLVKNQEKFIWNLEQQQAFEEIKNRLANAHELKFFDKNLRTRLVADASPVGIGCVLVQFDQNGEPGVVSYAAKSLTDVEKRYCQTEREALALVWGVERHSHYLLGKRFELETDHKCLELLFSETSTPCARIERWVLRLQAYNYKVVYKAGQTNIADTLSRLSATEKAIPFDEETDAFINAVYEAAAIDISEIETETEKDPVLQKLKIAIDTGNFSDPDLIHYRRFQTEFGYTGNLIVRHTKLVIPKSLQSRMLELSHEGHPGESLMRNRIRSKCWWPKMDADITKCVINCFGCRLVSKPERPEPMIRRQLPDEAWSDLAVDFLGPMPTGEYLMVIVDYFSRYMEIVIMRKITADDVIKVWETIFTRLGYPRTIKMDNGRQFVSKTVEEYCKLKGILKIHTTPYWPQANGEVERQNRTILKRLRIAHATYGDWKKDINRFLQMYYSTPHSTTGKTPAELMGRAIRTKIPGIEEIGKIPQDTDYRDKDKSMKEKGKESEDAKRRSRIGTIGVGSKVLQKNQFIADKLSTAFSPERFTVIAKNGSNVTIRSDDNGNVYDRNVAHLKPLMDNVEQEETPVSSGVDLGPNYDDEPTTGTVDNAPALPIPNVEPTTNDGTLKRSTRNRRCPNWVSDYVLRIENN